MLQMKHRPKKKKNPTIHLHTLNHKCLIWARNMVQGQEKKAVFLSLLYFALEMVLLQHRLWLAGWGSAHLRYRSL